MPEIHASRGQALDPALYVISIALYRKFSNLLRLYYGISASIPRNFQDWESTWDQACEPACEDESEVEDRVVTVPPLLPAMENKAVITKSLVSWASSK